MDYRCPVCRANLENRKLSHAVVTRMEINCSHCKSKIRLNVHRAEEILVLLSFGTIVVLAALAYWFQSQGLLLSVFGTVMVSALALPLLEQTYLRSWPRYVPTVENPDP